MLILITTLNYEMIDLKILTWHLYIYIYATIIIWSRSKVIIKQGIGS